MTSVEVQITNTGGVYTFPDDQILRNKPVVGMFFHEDVSFVPGSDRPAADKACLNASFLELKSGNSELLDRVPLVAYMLTVQDSHIKPLLVEGYTPSKSQITVANPGSTVTAGQSFYITFIYLSN